MIVVILVVLLIFLPIAALGQIGQEYSEDKDIALKREEQIEIVIMEGREEGVDTIINASFILRLGEKVFDENQLPRVKDLAALNKSECPKEIIFEYDGYCFGLSASKYHPFLGFIVNPDVPLTLSILLIFKGVEYEEAECFGCYPCFTFSCDGCEHWVLSNNCR